MGTSKSYEAPTTPQWGKLKGQVTRQARDPEPLPPHDEQPEPPEESPVPPPALPAPILIPLRLPPDLARATEATRGILGGFINAGGGGGGANTGSAGQGASQGASTRAARSAQRVARSLGGFFSNVGAGGAQAGFDQLNLGNLEGKSSKEVVVALTDALGGSDITGDDVDARNALSRLLKDLLKDAPTQEIGAVLEAVPLGANLGILLYRYFGFFLYEQFTRYFHDRLVARLGESKAEMYLKNSVLPTIQSLLKYKTQKYDARNINWAGQQGRTLAQAIMLDTYNIFTG